MLGKVAIFLSKLFSKVAAAVCVRFSMFLLIISAASFPEAAIISTKVFVASVASATMACVPPCNRIFLSITAKSSPLDIIVFCKSVAAPLDMLKALDICFIGDLRIPSRVLCQPQAKNFGATGIIPPNASPKIPWLIPL